jgi:Zn-dependent peptidase ImmA (M78 family)
MLAHELAHVVQQRRGPVAGSLAPGGIKISDPRDRFEQEAERAARRFASAQEATGTRAAERD